MPLDRTLFLVNVKLDAILVSLLHIRAAQARQGDVMNQNFEDLKNAVAAEKTLIDSAIVLLNGIAARIEAAGVDPAALQALTADINSEAAALGAAVVAGTPAEPPPPTNP